MGLSNESISDNDQAAEEKETMTFMVTMPMHKYLAALALVKRRQTNLNVVTEEAFDTEHRIQQGYDDGFGHPKRDKPDSDIHIIHRDTLEFLHMANPDTPSL